MFYYFLPALLSLAVAASPTIDASETAYPQQQEQGSQDLWDGIDIHELNKQLAAWNNEPVSSTEPPVKILEHARHGYHDIPRPIPPHPIHPTLPPDPFKPPKGCLAPRGQFPSPRSCSHYLNCWDDVVIEQQCPGGLLFNELISACDFEYNTYCAGRPGLPPKPELPPGATVCPEPNGRYRSSTNCSEFYVCVYGRPVKYSCPRRTVYNEQLGVCDYTYRVNCRGAAIPPPVSPPIIPHPPTLPPIVLPTQPPTQPPKPPQYPHPQPPYHPPHYPQHPYYPPYQPQYPYYPPQPQQPGAPAPSNPWLSTRIDADPWHQRPAASVFEIQQEKDKLAKEKAEKERLEQQGANFGPLDLQQDAPERPPLVNPWEQIQAIPAQLTKIPCRDGDIHRLTDSCTSVVVCRKGRPQLVQCPSPQIYDRPSDSCKVFTLAKC